MVAPTVWATNPSTGSILTIRPLMVPIMRQPPDHVPSRDDELREVARAEEGEGDDRHRLLRIVRAVAEGDETAGEELEPAERTVSVAWPGPAQEVEEQDGDDVSDEEADDR